MCVFHSLCISLTFGPMNIVPKSIIFFLVTECDVVRMHSDVILGWYYLFVEKAAVFAEGE